MNHFSLDGLWSCPSASYPEYDEIMSYDPRMRIICFAINSIDPVSRIPVPLWYQIISDSKLLVRAKPNDQGWISEFRFEGDLLVLINPHREHICKRLNASEVPDWVNKALEIEHAKMDKREFSALK